MEFARAGAVKHCTVDHLVAKLCEVLKCHLCQMFSILAEKAKISEDTSMQELEERQAFKWLPSADDAAALVLGYLKALTSAIGGRKRTSANGA